MALPYVTPSQLTLVENKINNLNKKLTDEDIESIKAVQSPKDATAGTVLTADGKGKATYKPTSTAKHLYPVGLKYAATDKTSGKVLFVFTGNGICSTNSESKPSFPFIDGISNIMFGGYGKIDTDYAVGTVGVFYPFNRAVDSTILFIKEDGTPMLSGFSFDSSTMEMNYQAFVGDKIQ